MDNQVNKITEILNEINISLKKLKINEKTVEIEHLKQQSQVADFWQDNQRASKIMQKIDQLITETEPWIKIKSRTEDILEIAKLNDIKLKTEIDGQLNEIEAEYQKLKKSLRFNGPYDNRSAVVSVHAGAGGTDAQDWAEILYRMYVRWADANNYKVNLVQDSPGEEAGLKNVSFEVIAPNAFGMLKGEHGVHRLVRLSPFNANNLRQTSFAKVEVMPEIDEPSEIPLDDSDLKIDVFRAGGHGGQSVNTTDSAVRITHLPTGISVSIQNERSQLQNKETALKILRSKLAQLQLEQHAQKISELKGPNEQAAWGNQIRSYVMHPYTMVKDLRTRHETSQVSEVLDGDLNSFIDAYLELGA